MSGSLVKWVSECCEIASSFDIEVKSILTTAEKAFLKEKYSQLPGDQMNRLEEKLTTIHFSEMAPYYIMRYGFYEGHTDYRSDPIAIAFVFDLKRLPEIEKAFQGNLHKILTNHFTSNIVQEWWHNVYLSFKDKSSSQISRILKRLRLHQLVRKAVRCQKYYLIALGKQIVCAAMIVKEQLSIPALKTV